MAQLRQRFVDAAGDQADRIEALLRTGDVEGARRLAHGLAGRSGMFGFTELGEAARRVDEAEPAVLPAQAEELLARLRTLARQG